MDFILGRGEVALEVKGTERVDSRDLRAIKSFAVEYRPKKVIVVSNEQTERKVEGIHLMPWKLFLRRLWSGEIIK